MSHFNIETAPFVTIDGPYTRDVDDAIAVAQTADGFQLLIAIADPTEWVPIGSKIDTEALKRAATVYIRTDATQRMLPAQVSEGCSSLLEACERPALVFEIQLDHALQVTRFQPHAATIRVAQRLSYTDVPAVIADPGHPHHEQIKIAAALAQNLLAARRNNGALALFNLHQRLLTDEEGNLLELDSEADTIGHVVVQETMILTNRLLAEFMARSNIPTIYRNHVAQVAAPSQAELVASIQVLAATTGDLCAARSKLMSLVGRARYEGVAGGHYGLNLPMYLHATSPLRRYCDLVNLRQLKAHFAGEPLPYSQARIVDIAASINATLDERRAQADEFFKGRIEKRAKAQVEAGRLQQLDDVHLAMAVKSARENDMLPAALSTELCRRMQAGTLSDSVAMRLLFGIPRSAIPDSLAEAVSLWLVAAPPRGVRLHNHATSIGRLIDASVTTVQSGSYFQAAATALDAAGNTVGGSSLSERRKDAEQLAICELLRRLLDLPLPSLTSLIQAPLQVASSADNGKSALFEACAKRGIASPTLKLDSTGAAHTRSFTCTASLNIKGRPLTATSPLCASKRTAESQACAMLLEKTGWMTAKGRAEAAAPLPTSPSERPAPKAPARDTGNPVGDVQEHQQRNGLPLPEYDITTIALEPPRFACTVTLSMTGGIQTFSGEGPNKAEAKKQAARQALVALSPAETAA